MLLIGIFVTDEFLLSAHKLHNTQSSSDVDIVSWNPLALHLIVLKQREHEVEEHPRLQQPNMWALPEAVPAEPQQLQSLTFGEQFEEELHKEFLSEERLEVLAVLLDEKQRLGYQRRLLGLQAGEDHFVQQMKSGGQRLFGNAGDEGLHNFKLEDRDVGGHHDEVLNIFLTDRSCYQLSSDQVGSHILLYCQNFTLCLYLFPRSFFLLFFSLQEIAFCAYIVHG